MGTLCCWVSLFWRKAFFCLCLSCFGMSCIEIACCHTQPLAILPAMVPFTSGFGSYLSMLTPNPPRQPLLASIVLGHVYLTCPNKTGLALLNLRPFKWRDVFYKMQLRALLCSHSPYSCIAIKSHLSQTNQGKTCLGMWREISKQQLSGSVDIE